MSFRNIALRVFKCPKTSFRRQEVGHQVRGYKPTWEAPVLRELKTRKELQLKKFGGFETSRSKYIEWNHEAEIYAFGKRLGEEFDREKLRTAFTHKSYINKEIDHLKSVGVDPSTVTVVGNEDLINKGSDIIAEIVHQYLKAALPRLATEGIQSLHNYLCSNNLLATCSSQLGAKDIILCEEYPPSEATLANTLKAIVAALELSSGIARAHQFVIDFIIVQLAEKDVYEICDLKNPMGLLCKELEAQQRLLPEARILRQTGSSTILGVFQVGLFSDRKLIGKGFGETPEIAETMAAHDSLRRLYSMHENMAPLPFGDKAARLLL